MDRAEVARGTNKRLPVVALLPNRTSPREFVARICAAWRQSAEGILEAGRLLCEAKAQVEAGCFQQMVRDELPFSLGTARKLMAIANNPVLSKHVEALPPNWSVLHALTVLPTETLRARIEDGTITPRIKLSDVAALRGGKRPKPRPASCELKNCVDYVRKQIEAIGAARRAELIARLRDVIDQLEALGEMETAAPITHPA
jgi:hypothetical protein